jgi:hypothetical protein
MKTYIINAIYKNATVLYVEVPEGADPMDPANWHDIVDETVVDTSLWDVLSAEEEQPEGSGE